MADCNVCFHHCHLNEGQYGICKARAAKDGSVVYANYGFFTSLALDPIEKKPLYHFYPGSRILSVGSYGCNLRCPFCQNYEISYDGSIEDVMSHGNWLSPENLVGLASMYVKEGNIGVAFTYNEPLVGYEYIRDAAKLLKDRGLKTVLVSNGTASATVVDEILPYIDAMNIDLKGFTDHYYSNVLMGNRRMVMDFIERVAGHCHLEVTTLVVPGENDSPDEIDALATYLAEVGREHDVDIPLHLTRFFPRYHMTDRNATDVYHLFSLVDVASKHLKYVHPGNV